MEMAGFEDGPSNVLRLIDDTWMMDISIEATSANIWNLNCS